MKKLLKIIIVVMLFLVAALLTSSTIWYKINDNIQIGLNKIQDCYAKVDIEYNYTCETDYFNYTSSYAWCWEYNGGNSTYGVIFEHSFDRGNIPTQTIWWNVTQTEAYCENTGSANVYLNKTGTIYHWVCDYSAWGECKVDTENKRLVCDSKFDGNQDGVCDSGESCLMLNVTKEGLQRAKNIGFSNVMDRYDIDCEIQ